MTFYSRADYGVNVNAGRNPNADNGWGGHQWPAGVPADKLALVTVPGNVKIVVRRELAELVALNYQIADVKYGRRFTRGWTGGYNNRPIAGTSSPSNHSKGKAIDNDASQNPMSSNFQCDIPPGLVRDWESTGWYWGGRYTGKADTMHFEYCFSPAQVQTHILIARRILGSTVLIEKGDPPKGADGSWPVADDQPLDTGSGPFVHNYVAEWQSQLNRRGAGLTVDGDWGPKTSVATAAWQGRVGRPATGRVSLQDWFAMPRDPVPTPPPAPAPSPSQGYPGLLQRGSKGAAVRTMQAQLNAHLRGARESLIAVDGDFGPATERAVRWFQFARRRELAVDGKVGPRTWSSLWR